ncbi:hypothetical protein BBJ28_00020218, partial [Nothophytophthora sp. Chile5]
GTVSEYNISDPTYGACRLKGISDSSDNFKYYASVSGSDETLNNACARCITVTRDDDSTKTVTAFVLDVCDGCAAGTLQLSSDALTALSIDTEAASVSVSYEFDTCPSSMMSGDIKACLMEGASSTYVPLQFYNSQKVITAATIDDVNATRTTSSFLYSANSGSTSTTWYKSIDVSVTSEDGETKNTTFAFTSTSGCATSDAQFNSASTADGVDGSTVGSTASSSMGAIVGGVVGGVGALLIIVGSIIFIRRRNRASRSSNDPNEPDVENQYLSPKAKALPVGTGTTTYQSDHDDDAQPPASPTVDYAESYSPAASSKQPASVLSGSGASSPEPAPAPVSVPVAPVPVSMPVAPVPVSMPVAAVPAAVVAASINVDSPMSSVASEHSSAPSAPQSNGSSGPRSVSAEPTFAYSNTTPSYSYSNMVQSPRHSTFSQAKAAPTLAPPVVPRRTSSTDFQQYDDTEERTSFDVDDMRDTEAGASTGDSRQYGSQTYTPYGSTDPYASTVTSPQSYVRATSLRRPSAKRNPRMSGRESGRQTNNSVLSNADSYASTAPRQTNSSMLSNNTGLQSNDSYAYSARPSMAAAMDSSPMRDSYASVPSAAGAENLTASQQSLMSSQQSIGSLRESGGYSRDSLNILGYPYSKKSGRHHNTSG